MSSRAESASRLVHEQFRSPNLELCTGYGHAHERLRKAVLVSGPWAGRLCPRCGKPTFPGQRLDMDHLTDEAGRRVRDNVYVPGYLSAVPNACRSGLCGGGGAGQRMFAGDP
jgi:hypothetical protein